MNQPDETKEWLLKWVLEPTSCPIHQVDLVINGDKNTLWKSCLICEAEKLVETENKMSLTD